MRWVIIRTLTLDTISWPKLCSCCGADVSKQWSGTWKVKVDKSLMVLFVRSTPKSVPVPTCDRCTRKLEGSKSIQNFGYGLAGLAFLGAVLVGMAYGGISPEVMNGGGGVFFVGALIGWCGEKLERRIIGTKVLRRGGGKWTFRFRTPAFADEFERLNA